MLRLPPYHCDLNPIEMAWASMKKKVAAVNIGKPSNEMPQMVNTAFDAIGVEEWRNYCRHVKKIEDAYRLRDGHLDEPFIVQLNSDSEEDSDDYGDVSEDSDWDSGCVPLNAVTKEHSYSKVI